MRLKEFGEKYPFLQNNLPFWEKYIKARDQIFNLLPGMLDMDRLVQSAFMTDSATKTPFLAYESLCFSAHERNILAGAFCDAMHLPSHAIHFPEKLPLTEELFLESNETGFIAAEVHSAIAAFVESVIAADEDAIHWLQPSCPICGAHAGMGLINPSGKKNLICSHCHTVWLHMRTECGLCGHTEERGATFLTADEVPNWLIETCNACGHSLKVLDMRNQIPHIITYPLHYLTTWELDLAARNNGYEPAMFAVFERAGWLPPLRGN